MLNKIQTFHDTSVGPKFLAIDSNDISRAFSTALNGQLVQTISNRNNTAVLLNCQLPDYSFKHEDSTYIPTVWAKNRNDGTTMLSVGIGLFRMICMNGLYFGVAVFGGKISHRIGARTENFVEALPSLLTQGVESIVAGTLEDAITDASSLSVTNPIDLVGSLPNLSLAQKDRVITKIALDSFRPGDRVSDAWGLYNVVNETIRQSSKSALRSAERDMGLLEEISFLAQNQRIAA